MRAYSFPYRLVMAVLLTVHALLLLYSAHCQFATRNEVAHVPAGLAVWKTGTFTLYRVNPPLWRMRAVLPVLAAQPNTDFADRRKGRERKSENIFPTFLLVCKRFATQSKKRGQQRIDGSGSATYARLYSKSRVGWRLLQG